MADETTGNANEGGHKKEIAIGALLLLGLGFWWWRRKPKPDPESGISADEMYRWLEGNELRGRRRKARRARIGNRRIYRAKALPRRIG